jgi:hypothetical protein
MVPPQVGQRCVGRAQRIQPRRQILHRLTQQIELSVERPDLEERNPAEHGADQERQHQEYQ